MYHPAQFGISGARVRRSCFFKPARAGGEGGRRAPSRRTFVERFSSRAPWKLAIAVALLSLIGITALRLGAEDTSPSAVEVYWKQSRTIPLPGVSHVEVFTDSVCKVQVEQDQVQIIGLERGESLVFVWVKERRMTWLVRVVEAPEDPHPHFRRAEVDESASHGFVGSSTESTTGSGAPPELLLSHRFQWEENLDGNRLLMQGQGQDATTPGAPGFNLNTASLQYLTPHSRLSLLDSIVTVDGGFQAQVVPASAPSTLMLRGADLDLKRGANDYEVFGGTTLPGYFLSLKDTRDVMGINFNHAFSPRLDLYSTTAIVDTPFSSLLPHSGRCVTPFQTLGLTARLNRRWAFQTIGGASSRGLMGQATAFYSSAGRSAFASFTRSSAQFPLNQLQLLATGRSLVSAGASSQINSKISTAVTYQHTTTQPSILFAQGGSSDYLNSNTNWTITPLNHLTFNYVFTRTEGGLELGDRSTGQREDVMLSSQLNSRLGNSAQVTVGGLSDPLQLNSESQFSLSDSLSFRLHSGNTFLVTFSQDRTDPSLVSRVSQEIGLLAPALQQLFLLDPVGFVDSPLLPPEIRTLLGNLQPSNTQISISSQFVAFNRLNLSPMVGYYHSDLGLGHLSDSHLAGYALSYDLTPAVQLQSTLSNVFLLDPTLHGLRRTTVFEIGLNRNLSAAPRWLLPSHGRRCVIRGRVFRDLNVNGIYRAGKPGMAGLRVELSSGDTARTDAEGRFEFSALASGIYTVRLPFDQFVTPVRATSPASVRVDLLQAKYAEVNFGIVNFSRIMGTVYNDYLANADRQPDSPPMRDVRLRLAGEGTRHEVIADAGGDYEFDQLTPGDYQLSIDLSTMPANFVAPVESYVLHLTPTSTVVQDVPLRALRSIAGKILFRAAPANNGSAASDPQPLSRVRLAVGDAVAISDADGCFLFRNLPAGRLPVRLIASSALPDGLKLPSGQVDLPHDPTSIQNAQIVISNPELLPYIQPPATSR